ncbi:mRNA export receptor, Tap, nucleoporin Mex67 [Schizosaccharomyces osmophilus]|uniref:mRNA export factor MEX67 n=1 Tax=Schizosaccharomyces osmophilus TaxID=2545709 RepID=A0AAE9WBY6_9SCHI|nr:mRNA export receptor, Tap, nucleoporin Mex67 [Schizosaccharomyces osmophilus]WBW73552.1 mRNA export receptor, Tap, nucleoporin Mex67 [Schizosaccharomyces osmophilus]
MLRRKRDRKNAAKENEMAIDKPLEAKRAPNKNRPHHEPPISVVITGHSKASEDDLISFVWRKAKVRLMNLVLTPASATAVVKSQDFPKLNGLNGTAFAGDRLAIRSITGSSPAASALKKSKSKRTRQLVSSGSTSALRSLSSSSAPEKSPSAPASSSTNETIEKLKQFLGSRYHSESKFLDLGSLQQDALLREMGILAEASTKSKMFPALMKVASLHYPDVVSVNLSDNNIDSVSSVTTLSQTWPRLLNLSIANNRISTLKDLEPWAPKTKFPDLQELVLVGNPICQTTYANQVLQYQSEMVTRFPKLRLLDGNPIHPEVLAAHTSLPFPAFPPFFDKPETQQLIYPFLEAFFKGWDTDRAALIQQVYSPQATFSVSLNSSNLRSKAVPSKSDSLKWGIYKKKSRNLLHVRSVDEQASRSYVGQEAIVAAVNALPKTRHDMSDSSQWLIEGWNLVLPSIGSAIKIVVHGKFEEPQNKSLTRNFDRVIIILPGGSTGVLVVNDMLIVRSYVGSFSWITQTNPISTPNMSTAPTNDQQAGPAALPNQDMQQQMVLRLKLETGLNDHFSRMCCEQNNWNYPQAMTSYLELKNQGVIPPEAFA